jgi:hypothetical protein
MINHSEILQIHKNNTTMETGYVLSPSHFYGNTKDYVIAE